jgi:DNA modification methylase
MPTLPLDQILSGDCRDVLPKLPENSVDLVFADPPYNLQLTQELRRPDRSLVAAVEDGWDKFADFDDYDRFTREWLGACRRVLKDTGTLWVIGSYHNIYRVGSILQDLGFWLLNDIIWLKTNPMPNFRGVRFTNAHETLLWAQKTKGAKYTFNHHALKSLNDDLQMRSDWMLPLCTGKERLRLDGARLHSTQKPEALLYRVLMASSNPGAVVLDPFFGSGTTGAVARKLGRHYIGVERDESYIKIAMERIAAIETASEAALTLQERRRQPRVPFGALLEAGLLQPGQSLFFAKDESVTATILSNGQIQCNGQTGSIHAVVRSLLEGVPANGWNCWLFQADGKKLPIDTLRQILQTEKAHIHEKTSSPP